MEYDEGADARRTGRRRHRWPAVLGAAAAAAVLVAGSVTGIEAVRHHSGASTPTTIVFTTADLATGDPTFRLGPDQVPSIAGLTASQAKALLERRGYRVTVSERSACPAAGDTFVTPVPGTILATGSTVTLHETTIPPNVSCAVAAPDDRVVAFLAWARGLGPAPRFASTVGVQFTSHGPVPGQDATLHGTAVADRSSWPGLESLADTLATPARGAAGLLPLVATPFYSTCSPSPGGTCPQEPAVHLAGSADATSLKSDASTQFDVMLEIDARGLITAVVLVDHREPRTTVDVDVVGDSVAYATARLKAYGFEVTATDADLSCAQRGQVLAATARGAHDVTIQVSRDNAACAA